MLNTQVKSVIIFRHLNQSKTIEDSIDIGDSSDISQCFGSVHDLTNTSNVLICKKHGTPCKALATLSPVYPQLFGKLISSALF